MTAPSRGFRIAVVALLVLAALAGAARRAPWDPDETRYLQVTRELLAGGSPFLLTFGGEPYPHKPPLFFWLLAPFVAALGPLSATAGALPSALALVALAVLVPRLGRTAGLAPAPAAWGGLMAVTALLPALLAGGCRMDLLLVVWSTLALDRLVALSDPDSSSAGRDHLLLWLWMGLGVLTKGPIALVLPLLAAAALLPVDPRPLRRALLGPGPLLALLLVALWLVPAALAGGREWLLSVVVEQTARRMADAFAHARAWWYHLATLPGTLLPWSAVVLAGTAAAVRRLPRLSPGMRLLAVVPVVSVAFLSAISGKTLLYPLPVFPPACLVGAWWLESARGRPGVRLALWATVAALAIVALGLGWAVPRSPRIAADATAAAWVAASLLAPALAAAGSLVSRRQDRAVAALVLVAPAFCAVGFQALVPAFDRYLSLAPFARAWLEQAPADQREVLVLDDLQPGYLLFTGRPGRLVTDRAEVSEALARGRLVVLKRKNVGRLGLSDLDPAAVRAVVPYRSSEVLLVRR